MSIESAKAFYNKITSDKAFNTQYQNASSNEERKEIILSAGYNFSPEEWQVILAENSNLLKDELSDRELTEVSGGLAITPVPTETPILEPSPVIPDPIGSSSLYEEPIF